jgi:hypothetical protein
MCHSTVFHSAHNRVFHSAHNRCHSRVFHSAHNRCHSRVFHSTDNRCHQRVFPSAHNRCHSRVSHSAHNRCHSRVFHSAYNRCHLVILRYPEQILYTQVSLRQRFTRVSLVATELPLTPTQHRQWGVCGERELREECDGEGKHCVDTPIRIAQTTSKCGHGLAVRASGVAAEYKARIWRFWALYRCIL